MLNTIRKSNYLESINMSYNVLTDKVGIELLQSCLFTLKVKDFLIDHNYINTMLFTTILKEQKRLSKRHAAVNLSLLKKKLMNLDSFNNDNKNINELIRQLYIKAKVVEQEAVKIAVEQISYKSIMQKLIDEDNKNKDKLNTILGHNTDTLIELDAKLFDIDSCIESNTTNQLKEFITKKQKLDKLTKRNKDIQSELIKMKAKALINAIKHKVHCIQLTMQLDTNKDRFDYMGSIHSKANTYKKTIDKKFFK